MVVEGFSATIFIGVTMFICPICKSKLNIENRSYRCENNHSFDIAKQGYVNLLPANKKHSAAPGDDKLMVVARNNFLSLGYYSHLKETLENLCDKYSDEDVNILDCGCGEGYYTQGVYEYLCSKGKKASIKTIHIIYN